MAAPISIHALLAESDQNYPERAVLDSDFYPRSPCGERHADGSTGEHWTIISIHALLAESDDEAAEACTTKFLFLSTLSLRRATCTSSPPAPRRTDFYPRSPCGERRARIHVEVWLHEISIHALLAESDGVILFFCPVLQISIHALLAESDALAPEENPTQQNFYPRSPCGERREPTAFRTPHQRFLSTLSLRRATNSCTQAEPEKSISIHALLAESDPWTLLPKTGIFDFYPRSPCGERLHRHCHVAGRGKISIHALLAESDCDRGANGCISAHFYPRSPCGERPGAKSHDPGKILFLSTLSLRRATCNRLHPSQASIHFYPRSPCGERPWSVNNAPSSYTISIHALLAESDRNGYPHIRRFCAISIHALLAESDCLRCCAISCITISIHALLAESDGGFGAGSWRLVIFLSTLSLRRATPRGGYLLS